MSSATTNSEVLEKLTTGDFSSGGLLAPEHFSDFFQDVQETSSVLNQVRGVPVTAPSGDIPRLGVGSRQFRQVNEGEASATVGADQPSVHYETVKMGGHTEITWETVNETIDDPVTRIINALADQFAVDLEALASVGDESSSDPFVGINDGWLTVAENRGSATYNHEDSSGNPQPVNKTLFSGMLGTLPERYKETQSLAFLMSYDQMQEYKEYLTDRSTAAGDMMLMQQEQPTGFGYPIISPNGWPNDQVMCTNLQNLCWVIQSNVRVKQTDEGADLVKRDLESVVALLAHTDFAVLEAEGVVIGNNVAAPS